MTASTAELLLIASGSYLHVRAALSQFMRRTPAQIAADQAQAAEFLTGVEVTESTWAEWEDTTVEIHRVAA